MERKIQLQELLAVPDIRKYDVQRPIGRQNVLELIRRIQAIQPLSKDHPEILKIVEELENEKIPDDKLIDVFKKSDPQMYISHLQEMIKELKYRSAGKPYQIFKSFSTIPEDCDSLPSGCWRMGTPFCVTEKVDGTQVQVHLRENSFQMLSHSGRNIINHENGWSSLKDLEPYAKPGHTTMNDVEYQGGNLTKNFSPLMHNLWSLMNDMGLKEAWFYFELTFKANRSGVVITPKHVPYGIDMANQCFLFCMTYNLCDDAGNPIEIVKLNINPKTLPIFKLYQIPTVKILHHGDAFNIDEFDTILQIVHNNHNIEGVIFAQRECYLKLITHYYTEGVTLYPIQERHAEWRTMQDVYHKYLALRKKPQKNKKKQSLNMTHVTEEFNKELSHNDWTEYFTKFYQIPRKNNTKGVFEFVCEGELTKKIIASLVNESEEFKDLKSKGKSIIIKHIVDLMINNKDDIREKFNIPSSKDVQ